MARFDAGASVDLRPWIFASPSEVWPRSFAAGWPPKTWGQQTSRYRDVDPWWLLESQFWSQLDGEDCWWLGGAKLLRVECGLSIGHSDTFRHSFCDTFIFCGVYTELPFLRPILRLVVRSPFFPFQQLLNHQVGSGGGYPETFQDLHLALGWLEGLEASQLGVSDLPRALVGHSAGGHLASWLGMQQALKQPMFPEAGEALGWKKHTYFYIFFTFLILISLLASNCHVGFGWLLAHPIAYPWAYHSQNATFSCWWLEVLATVRVTSQIRHSKSSKTPISLQISFFGAICPGETSFVGHLSSRCHGFGLSLWAEPGSRCCTRFLGLFGAWTVACRDRSKKILLLNYKNQGKTTREKSWRPPINLGGCWILGMWCISRFWLSYCFGSDMLGQDWVVGALLEIQGQEYPEHQLFCCFHVQGLKTNCCPVLKHVQQMGRHDQLVEIDMQLCVPDMLHWKCNCNMTVWFTLAKALVTTWNMVHWGYFEFDPCFCICLQLCIWLHLFYYVGSYVFLYIFCFWPSFTILFWKMFCQVPSTSSQLLAASKGAFLDLLLGPPRDAAERFAQADPMQLLKNLKDPGLTLGFFEVFEAKAG